MNLIEQITNTLNDVVISNDVIFGYTDKDHIACVRHIESTTQLIDSSSCHYDLKWRCGNLVRNLNGSYIGVSRYTKDGTRVVLLGYDTSIQDGTFVSEVELELRTVKEHELLQYSVVVGDAVSRKLHVLNETQTTRLSVEQTINANNPYVQLPITIEEEFISIVIPRKGYNYTNWNGRLIWNRITGSYKYLLHDIENNEDMSFVDVGSELDLQRTLQIVDMFINSTTTLRNENNVLF